MSPLGRLSPYAYIANIGTPNPHYRCEESPTADAKRGHTMTGNPNRKRPNRRSARSRETPHNRQPPGGGGAEPSPPGRMEGLWVNSEVMPDGTYAVTISYEGDRSWVLDRQGALRYAVAAVASAQRAEFDSALLKLLRHIKLGGEDAGHFIASEVRPDRPPLDDEATKPLRFVPGVTAEGKPFLVIELDGEPNGQLGPAELRGHAMWVLEATEAADLDAGLLRVLRSSIGLDESTGRAVVGDLAKWRTA